MYAETIQNKLTRLYNICLKELDEANIPYSKNVELKVNTRAKTRWGICKRRGNTYKIEISSDLLTFGSEEGIKNTIIHELLHSCKGGHGHTGEWKKYADIMNQKYGYNIKRCDVAEEKGFSSEDAEARKDAGVKYILRCNTCDREYKYKRENKYIKYHKHGSYCRCGKCHTELKLIVL